MWSFVALLVGLVVVVVSFAIGRKLENEEKFAKEQWGDLFKAMMCGKGDGKADGKGDSKGDKSFWEMVTFWKRRD